MPLDSGRFDSGPFDGGAFDGGAFDGGAFDGGPFDGAWLDASEDGGADAEPVESGPPDTGIDGGDCSRIETCDGLDQDCDGATDEGIPDQYCGVGVCTASSPGCRDGMVPSCTPLIPAVALDTCGNGLDDDCDGAVDEAVCGTELFQYTADVAPDADGWTLMCQGACPGGRLEQEPGRVRVIGESGAARWYERSMSIAPTGTTGVQFRVRGSSYSGLNSAFVMAAMAGRRLIVDVLPRELRIGTDCGSVSTAVRMDSDVAIRIEITGIRARTFVDGTMIDDRDVCPSTAATPVVAFGSGNPSAPGAIIVDDVLAYTRP